MQSLVSDLLDVTRIESGQLSIAPEDMPIGTLLDEALELVAAAAAEKRIRLEKVLTANLPPLWADRERSLQVLGNLLGNAVKFTPAEGRVVVRVDSDESGLAFSVEDTGPGIVREHLPRVFDRFWQEGTPPSLAPASACL
ncbi:MAG TPA: ATP-binding protein [Polyangiaceae bacterium]|nr:ATP-binding protein [Polyangiaceae bacterium]